MNKIALIGLGYWGKNHLKNLIRMRDENYIDELVVCDINYDVLKEVKEKHSVEIQTNWKSVLNDDTINFVDIVTPSSLHFFMTKKFLEAKKDVFVEKPLALTVEECKKLIKTRNATGSGLMVGHIFRFHQGVNFIKKKIEDNELGDIFYIYIRRQNIFPPRKDMGVLLALGIHDVDLTSYLLGDIEPDYNFIDLNKYYDHHEEMSLIIQKYGNITAYSFESWLDPTKGKLRELQVIGNKRSVSLDFSIPNKIYLYDSFISRNNINGTKPYSVVDNGFKEISLPFTEPLYEELKHFVNCSLHDKRYITSAEVGLKAIKMITNARKIN